MLNQVNLSAPLIWVEGIIGSGKTTLAKQLARALNLRLLAEPVRTNPFLELFYRDQRRWAFSMQMYLLHRRYNLQQLAAHETLGDAGFAGAILDRGLPGDRVFARLLTRNGFMHELEWRAYEYAYATMSLSLVPPSLLLFLEVEPAKALERIRKRARGAEVNIGLDYLEELRDGYLDLLAQLRAGLHHWSRGVSIMMLPWNVDDQAVEPVVEVLRRQYWPDGPPIAGDES